MGTGGGGGNGAANEREEAGVVGNIEGAVETTEANNGGGETVDIVEETLGTVVVLGGCIC